MKNHLNQSKWDKARGNASCLLVGWDQGGSCEADPSCQSAHARQEAGRDGSDVFYNSRLSYSTAPKIDANHAVFISVSSSFLAKSCFFNRASTSTGR